ncbi:protein phosphatase 1 regulatory subunit 12A isoform X9 [Octopus vulgaris]|uniref:Protein phosphatase 1 regulatory subunit 12B n=1 Tax=Octopus vulgaris TaxID=6645 RepID=A0AA36AJG8_OCTVU|nr:protein phosphatase 1 regulatory subunit 12A isoform X9 [Octopus vulgaris]
MADDNKATACARRNQQLKRWADSDTNRESIGVRDRPKRVNFQDGCVFLAACSSGDKDEVIKLLARGADINTANVDGLTALHQACIDDKIDMVKFLVDNGADVDVCDNEGWTPLHATASCGFTDIAQYLISTCANIAAVNNDGDLPLDICEDAKMEKLLQEEMNRQGVDAEAARREEEEMMLSDANQWLNSNCVTERPHAKTGAVALHVAAAKGYIKVMHLLIQAKANVNIKDSDGWTPLHAAAHWGQDRACKILAENFCDMDSKNNAGQTAFDVADTELLSLLEELKKKQAMLRDKTPVHKDIIVARGIPPKRRTSVTRMSGDQKHNVVLQTLEQEKAQLNNYRKDEEAKKSSSSSTNDDSSSESETERQNLINKNTSIPHTNKPDSQQTPSSVSSGNVTAEFTVTAPLDQPTDDRLAEKRTEKLKNSTVATTATITTPTSTTAPSISRSSLVIGDSFGVKKNAESTDTDTKVTSSLPSPSITVTIASTTPTNTQANTSTTTTSVSISTPTTTTSITTDISRPSSTTKRTFEPPKRDEETETQRKARARKARETRRSTQGISTEDIARAKALKQTGTEEKENKEKEQECDKDSDKNDLAKDRLSSEISKDGLLDTTVASDEVNLRSHRTLEERSHSNQAPYRRPRESELSTSSTPNIYSIDSYSDKEKDSERRESSALKARRAKRERRSTGVINYNLKSDEESNSVSKEENESDDSTSLNSRINSGTSSRCVSTSDIPPSITDRHSRSDRPSSYAGLSKSTPSLDIDYKKLYENEKDDTNRLKKELDTSKRELSAMKLELERFRRLHEGSSIESNQQKREKRALERKLSELESAMVEMDNLRSINARLKEENGALIRVVSKLSK